jgi:hypothetical protein
LASHVLTTSGRTAFATLVLAVGFASSLQAPVMAQQQAAPAQAAPAQAAPAQIPASHLAAAREVIMSSGMNRGFDTLIPQYMEQLKATFSTTRPEIANDITQTLNELRPEFEKQREDIINTTARLYAQALSEPDLKEIAAFFKSPAGTRYVSAQPRVLDGLFVEMQAWSRRLSEYMLTRVRAELKKKNIDL